MDESASAQSLLEMTPEYKAYKENYLKVHTKLEEEVTAHSAKSMISRPKEYQQ